MPSRLTFSDLPEPIQKAHKKKEIHKITKPTSTMISIHLKNHSKINYKKRGSDWVVVD